MLNNSQAKTILLLYLFTFVFVQGINIPIKNTPAIGPAIALEKVPSICNGFLWCSFFQMEMDLEF